MKYRIKIKPKINKTNIAIQKQKKNVQIFQYFKKVKINKKTKFKFLK